MVYRTLVSLLLLYSSTSIAQKNTMDALWRDSTIVIDGIATDWQQPFRYYDSKSKLQYNVVNDDTAIYICLKTADPATQMKILRAGMDLWLDTTAKKKEVSGIHFPLRGDAKLEVGHQDPDMPSPQHHERPDVKRLKRDFATSMRELRPQGLRNIPNDFTPLDNQYGIQVAINWDNNDILTYELRLPFRAFYHPHLSPADTLQPITLLVKVNGMEVPASNTNNTNMGSPTTDMTGSMNGQNGMNGNRQGGGFNRSGNTGPPPGMGAGSEMAQSYQLMTKVKLAYR